MLIKYTTIDTVIAKLGRDFGINGIDEGKIIEWAGAALEGIGVVGQYEEAVAFIEVKNHQCLLPTGLHAIIQLAKNNCFTSESQGFCPKDVVSEPEVNPLETPSVPFPVILDCSGQPIVDYELAYYRPYFDFLWTYNSANEFMQNKGCFSTIRKANGSFSDVLICEIPGSDADRYYSSDSDEYQVIAGTTLRFNFKEGQICICYLRQPLDENGYPMIPDNYSYLEAIVAYIIFRVMSQDYYAGRQGAEGRMRTAENQWQWYCAQAQNEAMMPNGIDEWENLMQSRNYIVPRTQQYNNFFGKFNRGQSDRYRTNHRTKF